MEDQNALVEQLREAYPDLTIETVRLNSQGWSNQVLIVNERLIFRFPRSKQALHEMEVEVAILQGIQEYITLPIPNPIYYNTASQVVGHVFMGYSMLPGEPLWRDTFAAIDDEEILNRLAQQLGTFLQELHNVPVSSAIAGGVPNRMRQREEWAAVYEEMQGVLLSQMIPAARRHAVRRFEMFLSDASNFNYGPCLTHRDFATSNILVSSLPLHISGIIDFGRSGLADPAIDFAGILYGYGEPFLERFFPVYPQIETAFNRARFYNESFALETALSAIENNDRETLNRSLEWYNRVSSTNA